MNIRLRAPAIVRAVALLAIASAGVLATAGSASATGTMMIQHVGSDAAKYRPVGIQVIHNTLNITSADGKGTLIITRAACTYQGDISVCLPTGVTLVQDGGVHALDLRSGTVYANMTTQTLQLPHSSTQLPPGGVLMTLHTVKGTFINLDGKIDKVTK
jgi:hypothetical protein